MELVGLNLILLGVLLIVYPLSSQDEMALYIYTVRVETCI